MLDCRAHPTPERRQWRTILVQLGKRGESHRNLPSKNWLDANQNEEALASINPISQIHPHWNGTPLSISYKCVNALYIAEFAPGTAIRSLSHDTSYSPLQIAGHSSSSTVTKTVLTSSSLRSKCQTDCWQGLKDLPILTLPLKVLQGVPTKK